MRDELQHDLIRNGFGFVLLLLIISSFFLVWLALIAPRDPAGMLCDDATMMKSIGAMMRGRQEVGCAWHDSPILEVEGLSK